MRGFGVIRPGTARSGCVPGTYIGAEVFQGENSDSGSQGDNRAVADRFWARVDRSQLSPGGCWPWTGPAGPQGYGYFAGSSAHRFACLSEYGPATDEKPFALHRCDNPPCCNPAHLRWGDAGDNARDAVERGRASNGKVPATSWVREPRPRGYRCTTCGRSGHTAANPHVGDDARVVLRVAK